MTEEKIKAAISLVLSLGTLLAVIFVVSGATFYLLQQGQKPISYQAFSTTSHTYTAIRPIILGAFNLEPFALIFLGFLSLVFSQILRVLILGFFFLKSSEYLLALSSFFIFIILIYSMLWQK